MAWRWPISDSPFTFAARRMNPPWSSSRNSYQISGWSTFEPTQPVFLLFTSSYTSYLLLLLLLLLFYCAKPILSMFWSSSKKINRQQVIHNNYGAAIFLFLRLSVLVPFTLLRVFRVLSPAFFCIKLFFPFFRAWQKTFLTWNLFLLFFLFFKITITLDRTIE